MAEEAARPTALQAWTVAEAKALELAVVMAVAKLAVAATKAVAAMLILTLEPAAKVGRHRWEVVVVVAVADARGVFAVAERMVAALMVVALMVAALMVAAAAMVVVARTEAATLAASRGAIRVVAMVVQEAVE